MADIIERDHNAVDNLTDKFAQDTRGVVNFGEVDSLLNGVSNTQDVKIKTWDSIVASQIDKLSKRYGANVNSTAEVTEQTAAQKILAKWHRNVTLDYKHDANFAPHVNGFYMIFMVHGTWYEHYKTVYMSSKASNTAGLSEMPNANKFDDELGNVGFDNPNSYFNMLATDIDVPDITEEYISVSSRIRNSFVPSREYFVSDFSVSYIESINLDVIRYHEAWHKYMNLLRRGEVNPYANTAADIRSAAEGWSSLGSPCNAANSGYFVETPFTNAVWIAVFRPFTTEIQLLIKLIGVMPVTMPLKQVVGNRSASKMTVLNMSYKASDMFYKFYNNTTELIDDTGLLASSFRREVMELADTDISVAN